MDDIDRRSYRAMLVLGALGGLWLTRHGLTAEVPAGTDVMGHVARVDAGLHLLAQGRLDGWFTTFGSGYRLFGVYGQGFTLAVGVVKAISLGTLDTPHAVGVVGSLSMAAVPPALASLSRSLGSSRRVAAIHGALGLSVSFGYGGGLAGLYSPGLVPHTVAIPLLLLTASALVRATSTRRARPVALGALGVAALVITHPISVVVLLVLLPGLVLGSPSRPGGRVGRVLGGLIGPVLALLWGALLAGFWVVPALAHRSLRGGLSGWAPVGLGERVRQIAMGEALAPQAVAIAGAVAIAWMAGRAIRDAAARRLLVAPAWGAAVIAVGFTADAHGWPPHEAWAQVPNRALAVTGCLLLLPLAALVADLLAPRGASPHLTWSSAAIVAVVALAVPMLLPDALDPPQIAPPPTAELLAVANTLATETAPSTRHLVDPISPFLDVGTSEVPRWLAVTARRPTAELYFPEATASPAAGLLPGNVLQGKGPQESLGPLRRAGIGAVVIGAPEPAAQLTGQAGYRRIAVHGSLEVWAIEAETGAPAPTQLLQPAEDAIAGTSPGLDATLRSATPERLRWTTSSTTTGPVVAAVAFDPSWKVTVDGEPVRTSRSGEGLLRFELAEGDHRVVARFADDGNDPLGIGVTLLAAVGLVVFAWTQRRRRAANDEIDSATEATPGTLEG